MTTACNHAHSHVTSHPQPITLRGPRTSVELAIAVTATCDNGHTHALHVTDISDVAEAANRIGTWAEEHADNCPASSK
jgi:hypothetical protein